MALPVIATPIFDLILPSTGKKYKYRPFLVKEEKILLIALEGGDTDEITNAVKQIIKSCVQKINIDELALFDLEYVFLKLREKSIGDTISLVVKHKNGFNSKNKECNNSQEVKVKLSDISIKIKEGHDKKIQLTDSIGIMMKYPSVAMVKDFGEFNNENAFKLIEKCVEYIYDEENTYPASDCKPNEIKDFVESLSHQQFELLEKFFDTMPSLEYELEWTCEKCGDIESMTLTGLNDFFI